MTISRDQQIAWHIGYLQYICKTNNVPYTGHERREELEGLLTTSGVSFQLPPPASAPTITKAVGTTSNPSTTNTFSGTAYVLPDPQITLSMNNGKTAIITAEASITVGGSGNKQVMVALAYSKDGGTTWTNIGSWISAIAAGGTTLPFNLQYPYTADATGNVVFGLRIANTDGATTITALNNQRQIMGVLYN